MIPCRPRALSFRRRSRRFPGRRRAALVSVVLALGAIVGGGRDRAARQRRGFHAARAVGATKPPDGVGVTPGKIKHVWLIILENKSYDTTFTGLNKNTYLWQTLPKQGVLLKNYYGTGHDSPGQLHLARRAGRRRNPTSRTTARTTTAFSGQRRQARRVAEEEQELRPDGLGRRRQRRRGPERLRVPEERPDAVQPARRQQGQLEGLRAGPRQPRDAGRQPAATASAPSTAAHRSPSRARPARRKLPQPAGRPTPPTSTSRKHFPFPWFQLGAVSRATATPSTSPTCSRPATASTTTCRRESHDAGLQLDHTQQLLRRPRRGLRRQQPLGRLGEPEHAEGAGQLHRRAVRGRPVPRARDPDDRALARVP